MPDQFISTENVLLSQLGPIAIVGNGHPGRNMGTIIDRFATVIRLNNFKIDGFEVLVGSKTTLRCTSGWNDIEIRCQHPEISPFHADSNESAQLTNYIKRGGPSVITPSNDIHLLLPDIPNPSTGLALAALASSLGIEVILFGFDGFTSGHYWNPGKLVTTTHLNNERDAILKLPNCILYGTSYDYSTLYDFCHSEHSDYNNNEGLRIYKKISNNITGEKIIEYGAGNGDLALFIEKQGNTITAIEISKVAFARIPVLHKINGDCLTLAQLEGAYDRFVSFDVLEHLTENDIRIVMREAARLAEKALISISTRTSGLLGPRNENLHLTVRSVEWWRELFSKYFTEEIVKIEGIGQIIMTGTRLAPTVGKTSDHSPLLKNSYELPEGYISRIKPEYFIDSDEVRDGVVWQPDVYPLAVRLARSLGCNTLIDIGCGHAQKLASFQTEFNIIGFDYGANIEWCRKTYSYGIWLESDFEQVKLLPLPDDVLKNSILICSDVIEHLYDPRALLGTLRELMKVSPALLLSTPDRISTWGTNHLGPPPNPTHIREWSLPELQRLLLRYGFTLSTATYTRSNNSNNELSTALIVAINQKIPEIKREEIAALAKSLYASSTDHDKWTPATSSTPLRGEISNKGQNPFHMNLTKIIAIISAHNEGDVIYHVIGDLILQGIEVYLINHCSTDSTVTEASKWLGKGLLHIENFPQDAGYPEINKEQYIWQQILQRKEELADQLGADWYIHSDADEFRESPWPGLTLKQAIQVADRMGYNALDFELLNFRPVNNYFIPGTDVRETLRYYEGSEVFNSLQIKAWKNLSIPVSIFKNGGHDITFPGRSVCPIKFLLRHYPIRSQSHGERKVFQERKNRFNSKERKVGWHIQYDLIEDERHNFLQSPSTLSLYDGDQVRLKILSSQARRMAEELSGVPAPAMESPQQCRTVVTGRSSCGAATSAGISQLITRANDMANNGKSTEALQLYQQALEVDPGNCRALVGIGVVTLLQGNHTEAAISFSKALRTSPQDTNALCGLGMARLGQERHAIGFELFKKALDADPENLTAVAELTRCAYRLNRHGEAAGYVQRYLMHHPADKDMLFSLAGLLYKAGNLSEAYEQLERLLTFYPEYEGGEEFAHKLIAEMRESQNESATVQQLMASGQHHKEAGNYEEALVSFSRAHDLGEVSVLAQMGNCLARLGRLDEATTHYKSALQQGESNVDALIGLGVASLLSGKQVQAVTWFNKALKVDPADSQALTGLGMARTQQNKQKEAFPLFASALSGDPENLTALNELLRIAYEHDRLPEAEPFLKSYLMYHPTHQHILYSLAGLLYRIGKLTEAQETLERLTLFEPEYEGGKELEELIVNAMSTRETSAINEHGTL